MKAKYFWAGRLGVTVDWRGGLPVMCVDGVIAYFLWCIRWDPVVVVGLPSSSGGGGIERTLCGGRPDKAWGSYYRWAAINAADCADAARVAGRARGAALPAHRSHHLREGDGAGLAASITGELIEDGLGAGEEVGIKAAAAVGCAYLVHLAGEAPGLGRDSVGGIQDILDQPRLQCTPLLGQGLIHALGKGQSGHIEHKSLAPLDVDAVAHFYRRGAPHAVTSEAHAKKLVGHGRSKEFHHFRRAAVAADDQRRAWLPNTLRLFSGIRRRHVARGRRPKNGSIDKICARAAKDRPHGPDCVGRHGIAVAVRAYGFGRLLVRDDMLCTTTGNRHLWLDIDGETGCAQNQ